MLILPRKPLKIRGFWGKLTPIFSCDIITQREVSFVTVNLLNNTQHKKIRVVCGNREFVIKQNETVTVDVSQRFNLKVFIEEKNHVIFNFLDLLLDGFFNNESIINVVHCNTDFTLETDDSEAVKTISLDTLEARNDLNQFVYFSIYPKSEDVKVLNTEYLPTDTRKQKRKSAVYLLLLASGLWALIPSLIGFIRYGLWWLIFIILFVLFAFTIPCFKKFLRLKDFLNEQYHYQ